MAIGLKGSWKETKGCSLRYRLKELKWNLKYAWQRAWKGYDSRDVFSMNDMFIERQKETLKKLRETHYGLFNVPEECRDKIDKLHFNEEETDAIIDKMINHLDMMDEDHVEKVLYGTNCYDDDYDFRKFTIEDYKRISDTMDENKNEFMKLFSLFFWDLWD